MAGLMDIIVRARDEASQVLDRVGEAGEKAGELIDDHWLKATAAMTGAALAMEVLNRKQQELTVDTRQLAARIGENEDAIRSWVTEVAGTGDDLSEMIGLMDLANRRGLEGKEALQGYAGFWDTLGDASGESATALAEAGVGLQQLGITAGEEGLALDAFGFVMDNTTGGVAAFLDFLNRTGPALTDMGASVDDAAAILGILEGELGLSGRVARTEFNQAVNESDGSLEGLLETLGITRQVFDAWRASVEGAGQAVERDAAIVNDAMTPLQHLQQQVIEVTYSFSGMIETISPAFTVIAGIGPAAKGAQLAMRGLAQMGPILGAAMHAALGPIGLITGAIALLAAGFATDFMGMRTGLETGLDDIAMNFGTMGDRVHELAERTGSDFTEMKRRIRDEMKETGDSFEEVADRIRRSSSQMTDEQWDAVEESGKAWEQYQAQITSGVQFSSGIVEEGVDEMADELGSLPQKGADALLAEQQRLADATTQLVDFMEAALSPAEEIFRLEGFLSSSELSAGLADGNPLVRQKAEELRDEAAARLAELRGMAYQSGVDGGFAFGQGLRDTATIAWVAGSAARTAAAARGIFPGSEPADPNSPLRGISTAWGFMETLAHGLDEGRELPAQALARSMGLLRDEIPSDGLTVGVGEVAGVGAAGFGLGAGSVTKVFQLIVDGVPKAVGSREDVLDAWEQMDRLGDRESVG